MIKKCRYCGNVYQKNSEHVFPYGLGGEDLFMNCVCEQCNNDFSALERELYQKSPIGLLRSVEGIEGYKKNQRTGMLKYNEILSYDQASDIVFEIGQYENFQAYIKPQIVFYNNDFYLDGPSKIEIEKLLKCCKKWKEKSLAIKINREGKYRTILFEKSNETFEYQEFQKIKSKRTIKLLTMSENNELYKHLSPRIFLADEDELIIRARTIKEGIDFIQGFLNYTIKPRNLKCFTNELQKTIVINVSTSFDSKKVERALVKIGLNCLIYNFQKIIDDQALDDCISFIKKGFPPVKIDVIEKNCNINSNDKTHNVFFYQFENSVNIKLSLFNGKAAFNFGIPNLHILEPNDYNCFVINYKERINRFEDKI